MTHAAAHGMEAFVPDIDSLRADLRARAPHPWEVVRGVGVADGGGAMADVAADRADGRLHVVMSMGLVQARVAEITGRPDGRFTLLHTRSRRVQDGLSSAEVVREMARVMTLAHAVDVLNDELAAMGMDPLPARH